MPLYEYVCETDGEVIELLRPASEADEPAPDPEGKGRVFTRKQSVFAAQGGAGTASLPMGECPCGKPGGMCGA